jgi:hypothetical protein
LFVIGSASEALMRAARISSGSLVTGSAAVLVFTPADFDRGFG